MNRTTVVSLVHNGEEVFILLTVNFAEGRIVWTSDPMNEDDLRQHLLRSGLTPIETDTSIATARAIRQQKGE